MKLYSTHSNPILWVDFVDNQPIKVSLKPLIGSNVVSGNVSQVKVFIDNKYGSDALFKFLDMVVAL